MSIQPERHPQTPRLILRAFTTDVDYRFTLLIFAILSSSLYIFRALLVSLPLSAGFTNCVHGFTDFLGNMTTTQQLSTQCTVPYRQLFLWLLLGEVILFGSTFLIYWFLPTWRCCREHLKPFPGHKYPKIIAALEDIRREPLRKIHLHYVWNEMLSGRPFVFGRLGKYYLFIPSQYVPLFSDNPKVLLTQEQKEEKKKKLEGFPTVMSHELSHLYNKDVNKTYFTIIIWYVFFTIALLPYIIFSLCLFLLYPGGGSNFAMDGLWRVVVMGLLVYLIRASVLRSRELSADAQAAEWGDPSELQRQIEELKPGKGIFSPYPTHEKRRRNIEEPEKVFALKMLDALGIGIIFGIAFPTIYDIFARLNELLSNWSIDKIDQATYPDVGTIIVCILLTMLVGYMIWRAVLIAGLRNQKRPHAGRFGLCLATGIIIGFFLSLYFTPFGSSFLVIDWPTTLFYLAPWALLLVIGCAYFCKWLALLATLWQEVINEQRIQRVVTTLYLVFAGLFLAVGLTLFSQLLLQTQGFLQVHETTLAAIMHPILQTPEDTSFSWFWRMIIQNFFINYLQRYYIFLAFASLWILPLLSWFWYRKGLTKERFQWASADPMAATSIQNPFRLRYAALIALIGSLLFCGLLLFIHLWPFETAIANGEGGEAILAGPFLLTIATSPFLLAALLQAFIAALITLTTRQIGIINGLFGAFLGGCLITAGIIGINHFTAYSTFRLVFLFTVNWGVICTLGTAFLIEVLRLPFQVQPQLREMFNPSISRQRKPRLLIIISCLLLVGILILLPTLAYIASEAKYQTTTNIVRDGDFESPMIVLDTQDEFSTGKFIGNWKVTTDSVFLIGTAWMPAHGAQSIYLNGSGAGAIYQDLPTHAETNYLLTFAISGYPFCPQTIVTHVQIWWNSIPIATVSFDTTNHDIYNMVWQYHTYHVHATSATTPLSFVSLTPSDCGPTLDNVTVTQ